MPQMLEMERTVEFKGFSPVISDGKVDGSQFEELKSEVYGSGPKVRGISSDEPTKRAVTAVSFVKALLALAEQHDVESLAVSVKNNGTGFEVDIKPSGNDHEFLTVLRRHLPRAAQANGQSPEGNARADNVKLSIPVRGMVELAHDIQRTAGI